MDKGLYIRPSNLESLEDRIAPATFLVTSTGDVADSNPGYEGTLRWAIGQSNDNGIAADTINFDPTVFTEGTTIELNNGTLGEMTIVGSLTIKGLGPDRTIIDAQDNGRIFSADDSLATSSTVSLSGLTLTKGLKTGNRGGAIYSHENLNLTNVILTDNSAGANGNGGAVSVRYADKVVIKDSVISNNDASTGGGVDLIVNSIQILNTMISGNTAAGFWGGGIYAVLQGSKASFLMDQSTVQGNSATDTTNGFAGGAYIITPTMGDAASVAIKNSTFLENQAAVFGGGLKFLNNSEYDTTLTIENSQFTGNSALSGGGISIKQANVNGTTTAFIKGSLISGNTVERDGTNFYTGLGGGIYLSKASATIESSIISTNRALPDGGAGGFGGGIYADRSTLVLKTTTVAGNYAGFKGGGIYGGETDVTLLSSTLSANSSKYGGGVAVNVGDLVIDKSAIDGNSASAGRGGGVLSFNGRLSVSNSAFSGNYASDNGGGLLSSPNTSDVSTITKTVFSGNISGGNGGGAYVYASPGTMFNILSSTFIGNQSDARGGGLGVYSEGTVLITSSKFSQNHAGEEGGGINVTGPGLTTITSSSITGNHSTLDGGGVQKAGAGALTLSGATITGNASDLLGGGLANNNAIPVVVVGKTVISGNFALGSTTMIEANVKGAVNGFVEPTPKTLKGTLVVTSLADDGGGADLTLREAIDAANAGGKAATIVFDPSLRGTITLASDLPQITVPVKILGNGADRVAISGDTQFSIFDIYSPAKAKHVISGLTLINGYADSDSDEGGAIKKFGQSLTVTNMIFSGNEANLRGGAISSSGGSLTVQNSLFAGNTASDKAGALHALMTISDKGAISIKNSMFVGNTASGTGGAAYVSTFGKGKILIESSSVLGNESTSVAGTGGGLSLSQIAGGTSNKVAVKNSIISGNVAETQGGGIYANMSLADGKGALEISNTVISHNDSLTNGGGVYLKTYNTVPGAAVVTIKSSKVLSNASYNTSGGGGGLFASGLFKLSLSKSAISANRSVGNGVGIFAEQSAVITVASTIFAGNRGSGISSEGGAFFADEETKVTLSKSTLVGNISGKGGAGAGLTNAEISILSSTLAGNQATQGFGGALELNGANATVKGTSVTGNFCDGNGGGIWAAFGSLTLDKAIIRANSAEVGGGVYLLLPPVATIKSSTISSNAASLKGGGIYAYLGLNGTLSVQRSTLSKNFAGDGGGVRLSGAGAATFTKTSVLANVASGTGGGMNLDDLSSLVALNGVTISGNLAQTSAGGVYNPAYLADSKTVIAGNFAPANPNVGS